MLVRPEHWHERGRHREISPSSCVFRPWVSPPMRPAPPSRPRRVAWPRGDGADRYRARARGDGAKAAAAEVAGALGIVRG